MALTPEQYARIDSRVTVEIVGVLIAVDEPAMLAACMKRIARFEHVASARLICEDRVADDAPDWKFPGRIEWLIRLEFEGGGGITIGALQRGKNAEFEFHS